MYCLAMEMTSELAEEAAAGAGSLLAGAGA